MNKESLHMIFSKLLHENKNDATSFFKPLKVVLFFT